MLFQEDCRILENINTAPGYFKIALSSRKITTKARPGQFVQVRVLNSSTPLLRRPFSFHIIGKDSFSLLYHVVGKGTEILSKRKKGETLNVIGPLGNGFRIIKGKTAILIAGGCGTAPLYGLEEELKKKKIGSHLFMGATTEELLVCRNDFAKKGTKLYISTDDGSCGAKCDVAALYSSYLSSLDPKKSAIYACGPKAMLKAVSDLAAKHGISCQVSMEERMACGIGACLGCVISTKDGSKRVCKDGPVFDPKEIIWQ
ncbi:MAG: dihydroorotate dehydrogenase electron transfer subunit [Candidatus Saganbacteria bacterium]|nr:dihydroorotate dehydrogenase electron transfer subunit [Candidatus Saganbacteria bacterium]